MASIARYSCSLYVSVRAVCRAGGEAGWGLVVSKPAIVAVDDDPAVAAEITRDLRGRYSEDCRVARATSGREVLPVLAMSVYFVHRYLVAV